MYIDACVRMKVCIMYNEHKYVCRSVCVSKYVCMHNFLYFQLYVLRNTYMYVFMFINMYVCILKCPVSFIRQF